MRVDRGKIRSRFLCVNLKIRSGQTRCPPEFELQLQVNEQNLTEPKLT